MSRHCRGPAGPGPSLSGRQAHEQRGGGLRGALPGLREVPRRRQDGRRAAGALWQAGSRRVCLRIQRFGLDTPKAATSGRRRSDRLRCGRCLAGLAAKCRTTRPAGPSRTGRRSARSRSQNRKRRRYRTELASPSGRHRLRGAGLRRRWYASVERRIGRAPAAYRAHRPPVAGTGQVPGSRGPRVDSMRQVVASSEPISLLRAAMRRNCIAGLCLLLAAIALEATPSPAGIVVENVATGEEAERAGLQPGDVLVSWKRNPNPPANPAGASGLFRTPFDVLETQIDQSPRARTISIRIPAPREARGRHASAVRVGGRNAALVLGQSPENLRSGRTPDRSR